MSIKFTITTQRNYSSVDATPVDSFLGRILVSSSYISKSIMSSIHDLSKEKLIEHAEQLAKTVINMQSANVRLLKENELLHAKLQKYEREHLTFEKLEDDDMKAAEEVKSAVSDLLFHSSRNSTEQISKSTNSFMFLKKQISMTVHAM